MRRARLRCMQLSYNKPQLPQYHEVARQRNSARPKVSWLIYTRHLSHPQPISMQMTEKRKSRSLPISFNVYSTVHEGKPCIDCILCNETQRQYTHPASWKNRDLTILLRRLEPNKIINSESCICRNCRDSLSNGLKDPANFQPRWRKENTMSVKCQVLECQEKATRSTNITSREHINNILTL